MKLAAHLRSTTTVLLLFATFQMQAQTNPLPVGVIKPGESAMQMSNEEREITDREMVAKNDAVTLEGLKLRNEKLFQHLTTHFSQPHDIAIFPYDRNSAIYCMVNDVRHNLLYTNKGKLLHTVRYYEPSKLPVSVAKLIRRDFPEYEIKYVSEINAADQTAYLVHTESAKFVKVVRVINESWDIFHEFTKQQ